MLPRLDVSKQCQTVLRRIVVCGLQESPSAPTSLGEIPQGQEDRQQWHRFKESNVTSRPRGIEYENPGEIDVGSAIRKSRDRD